ncbi:hypothetical protein IJ670_01780 [bacterium]|nr:hypothetical protein [bacterium]
MPISVNNVTNHIASAAYAVQNPGLPIGVAMEEIPCSLGRSWEGYKRGGLIEGAEKLRKELMSAAVWIFGIPLFNKIGSTFCEKALHIPMGMDFSDAAKGNDTIGDTVKFLLDEQKKNPNISKRSDITSFLKDFFTKDKIERMKNIDLKGSVEEISNNVKIAKKISTISAVVLNCLMMGVVIPKINQKLTAKKLEQLKEQQKSTKKPDSMDDFMKKNSNISFKGNPLKDPIAYTIENNNTFRLVITDGPMIAGRMLTSRNKYEALEYLIIDGGSIYFYNFSAKNIQKLLRKMSKTPAGNPKVANTLARLDSDVIKGAIDKLIENENVAKRDKKQDGLTKLFGNIQVPESEKPNAKMKNLADLIYEDATFGKYGKINNFVSYDDIDIIDSETVKFLKKVSDKIGYTSKSTQSEGAKTIWNLTGKEFDMAQFSSTAKKYMVKNAAFMAVGLLISIWGLSRFIPRLAYKVTQLLTGKNTFAGIENYDDDKKDNTKVA